MTLGNKAEKILGVVKEERIDLVVLPIPKTPLFPYLRSYNAAWRIESRLVVQIEVNQFCYGGVAK